jgi:hypothetical protein
MITALSIILFGGAFAAWTVAGLIAINPDSKLKPAADDDSVPRGGTISSILDSVRGMSRPRDQVMALSLVGLACALLAIFLLTSA